MLYRLYRLLAWLMLRLFFRRIEVEGRAAVPATGPVLFVANHTNALVDPLVLIITLRRRLTLTAKNVLGRNPVAQFLMNRLGIITFHRAEDVGHGADRKQNVQSLARCREILRYGGALCIFPEGISHSDPHLRPFRTGAARIALDYVREDGNPGGLLLIPTGLLYTEKDRFRSHVLLRFGKPLHVVHWLHDRADGTAHELTDEIRRHIEELTVNFEDRREELILSWGVQILATGATPPQPLGWAEPPLVGDYQLLKRLQAGYRQLVHTRPEEVQALTARVRQYRSRLKRLGIEPPEVFLPLHFGKAAFFLIREIELLLIGAPIALVGAINHAVPYWLVRTIARKLSRDKDHWASNVVYPSFLVFPLCYAVQVAAAWLLLPAFWAGVYAITLPYTGYVALLYGDRMRLTWRRLRTFLYYLRDRSRQEELACEGRAIVAGIRALGEQLPQQQGSGVGVTEESP
jgi:glycerol-3-phosphate O-acyltransferase / dihydroxyacetone phosphate acyltransferase